MPEKNLGKGDKAQELLKNLVTEIVGSRKARHTIGSDWGIVDTYETAKGHIINAIRDGNPYEPTCIFQYPKALEPKVKEFLGKQQHRVNGKRQIEKVSSKMREPHEIWPFT